MPHRIAHSLRPLARATGLAVFLAFSAAGGSASAQSAATEVAPERPSGWIQKKASTARREMVAAAHPLAVDAGNTMLQAGGTAVDAAIAVQLVLNLVEPQSSGIGGGAFLLVHEGKSKRLRAYDGRETAPAAAKPERFLGPDGKPMKFHDGVVGGRSVGVPGTLRVMELAHKQHGKLPWAKLFDPAIQIAENGFAVSPRMFSALQNEKFLPLDPAAKAYFYQPDGSPKPVGTVLKNPEFAATLRAIAARGVVAFYEGDIARDIVAKVTLHPTNPGDLTEADLKGYRAKERTPVCGQYRAYKVCGMPAPSSGGVAVLQMLGMLERFPMDRIAPNSPLAVHLIAEAGRLAYADRNHYLADPDFVPQPAGLTDPQYIASRGEQIKLDRSLKKGEPGVPPPLQKVAYGDGVALELPSTSHISVVDAAGNAVAMTTTIEDGWGSRQMVRGFLLNNELTDFSFAPADSGRPVANRVEANKRPRSSMAPTIVYDAGGRIKMVTGSPGGSAIINYVVKSLVGVLDWGLDPQTAVDLPNFGSRNGPTELEKDTPLVQLMPKLNALDHEVRAIEFNSGLHTIVRTADGWTGGADGRREGVARGR